MRYPNLPATPVPFQIQFHNIDENYHQKSKANDEGSAILLKYFGTIVNSGSLSKKMCDLFTSVTYNFMHCL